MSECRQFETGADLRLLTDSATNLLAYLDGDLRFRFANRAMEVWFGLARERILESRACDLITPSEYPSVHPFLQRALDGDHVWTECHLRTHAGEPRFVHFTLSPDRDRTGQVLGIVIVGTDVTDRKHVEELLSQQVAAFENIQDALIITDLDGVILQTNPAFTRHTGYTRMEAIGQPVSMLHRPPDRDWLFGEISAGVTLAGIWEGEIPYVRKDGSEGISATTVVPMRDSSGTVIGLIGSNRDITDLKRADLAVAMAYRREVALNKVSQAIRQSIDPAVVITTALTVLGETLAADRCLAILLDSARDQVHFHAEWKLEHLPSLLGVYTLSQFDVELDAVFPGAATLVVDDIGGSTLPHVTARVVESMGIRSMMVVPLSHKGEVFALLSVSMAENTRIWSQDEVAFVEAVASQLRAATEASRLLEETKARADREALMNKVSHALRRYLDPVLITGAAAAILGEALGVDRCFYMDCDWEAGVVTIGRDWRRLDLSSLAGDYKLSPLHGAIRELFGMRTNLVAQDIAGELSPDIAHVLQSFDIRSMVGVPIFEGGVPIAALVAAMTQPGRAWSNDDVDVIHKIATLTRGAIERARTSLLEHSIASQLQTAMQPPPPGPVHGLDIDVHYHSALDGASIGGDFYDVFPLDHTRHILVVGDLSGKGLPAATQIATVRNMLRYALHNAGNLKDPLTSLNRTLVRNELITGFATLFVGRFDTATRELTYVNCGQEPAMVRRASRGSVDLLMPTGPTLGISECGQYDEAVETLQSGDSLLIFTDGFTEVGPTRRDALGASGLAGFAAGMEPPESARALVQHMVLRVLQHSHGIIRDDMCLLGAMVC